MTHRISRFYYLTIITILSILLSLTACSVGTISPQKVDGQTKVTIQIDGAAVPYYAPLYVAKEKGYFKNEGLDVNFIYADASTVLKNVAVGNVEFGFPNGDSVVSAIANGVPISVVHTTYQQGIGAILSMDPNPVLNPADLRGKKVAVTSLGSPNYVQLQALSQSNHIDVKTDVDVKVIGTSSITEALRSKQVDAIIFSRVRYFALKAQGIPVHEVPMEEYLPSYGNVLVANQNLVDEYPQIVNSFIRALNSSLEFLINGGLNEGVDISKKYAPGFDGQEKQIVSILNELFVKQLWQSQLTKKNGLGSSDIQKWQDIADLQLKFGLIDKPVKVADYIRQPQDFLQSSNEK
ncbi:ABC transporter substrate-binding protein [Arcanobacterium ihumii]|uniref:ABC transporter substrate-binding protein n=1 Tax=Arcanobacterium ihumii TaxID=2138162 RepID=UPI000F5378B7|nr:ABC transporter substrate-binding protein [Arcanobacterium ihumii]